MSIKYPNSIIAISELVFLKRSCNRLFVQLANDYEYMLVPELILRHINEQMHSGMVSRNE